MAHRHTSFAPSVEDWLQASHAHQPLSERTVLELSRRIQRWQHHPGGPDHAPRPVARRALRARDQLVRHNLRLISHLWGRHRRSLPAHDETTADALQEAALNLVRAAEKFNPTKGYRFSTYATFWVRRGFAEIEQRCKRAIRFPAEKAALVLKAQRLSEQHQAANGTTPSLSWLASQLTFDGRPVSEQKLGDLLQQWQLTHTGSLDDTGALNDEGGALNHKLNRASLHHAAQQEALQQRSSGDLQRAELPELLDQLSEQQRRVISARYLRRPPLTPHQQRKATGLSDAELDAIEQQALSQLRQAAGVERRHLPRPRGLHRR